MVKMAYVIAGIALVLVLLGAGVFAYEQGMVPGVSQASPNPSAIITMPTSGEKVTAFQALAQVESDKQVKDWETSTANVSVTMISTDSSEEGLSDLWTINYVSDSGNVQVKLDNGSIFLTKADAGQGIPVSAQRITTTGLIDSDDASHIAQNTISATGVTPKDLASVKLTARSPGSFVWNLNYVLTNGGGYYIVRIDASNSSVLGSAQVD